MHPFPLHTRMLTGFGTGIHSGPELLNSAGLRKQKFPFHSGPSSPTRLLQSFHFLLRDGSLALERESDIDVRSDF